MFFFSLNHSAQCKIIFISVFIVTIDLNMYWLMFIVQSTFLIFRLKLLISVPVAIKIENQQKKILLQTFDIYVDGAFLLNVFMRVIHFDLILLLLLVKTTKLCLYYNSPVKTLSCTRNLHIRRFHQCKKSKFSYHYNHKVYIIAQCIIFCVLSLPDL